MKKLVGLLVVASFFLSSAVSVQAATYNSVEKPSAAIENASIWNRDVGDGIDTFKYENGNWVPVKSTSKRRSAAKKDYIDKVVTPNKESRKIAEELKQSYLAEAKKNPEAFAALAEEKSMMVSYTDDLGTHEVKIPKVDVPAEVEEPAAFFVSEALPVEELEVLPSKQTRENTSKIAFDKTEEILPFEDNKVITKADLLNRITYSGDKNELALTITSKMVYAAIDEAVYYHDLNTLLGKTTLDKVSVFTEEEAAALKLTAAPNDSAQVEQINLSLSGSYEVQAKNPDGTAATLALDITGKDGATRVEPDPEPTPTPQLLKLEVADHTFPVEVGSYLNNPALLDLVTYTGDKNNLKISIATEYVYVTPNAEVYHIDLHELLSKANLSTVAVMTEQEAVNKGLRLSTENNDKGGIDTIDRSLPGKYRVTYTDGQTSATSVITIGEVKSEEQIVTPTTPVTPKQTATPKTVPTTQGKSLPQTGSTNSNLLIVIGALILAAAAFLYWKNSSKKA
ncbi:LPXTG cell wall anchor domain-containing protein [Enterococcus sp. 669A]|uniref:LPXTG cell wall anchor domain-containing protein n=1 Tax=Candidatus Enterococcus moelleringii TaxID=2815325 RepID=A0ABS3LDN7_9ENTE|nr:LPXTG cell wall anchor domain-containing protein [Enterococcus sp. 669A]